MGNTQHAVKKGEPEGGVLIWNPKHLIHHLTSVGRADRPYGDRCFLHAVTLATIS